MVILGILGWTLGSFVSPYINQVGSNSINQWTGNVPNVYVTLWGIDSSFSGNNPMLLHPHGGYTDINPIKYPSGSNPIPPVMLYEPGRYPWQYDNFSYNFSNDQKLYILNINNTGKVTANNVYIKLDMGNLIQNISVYHPNRVNIVNGGLDCTYVELQINELNPNEYQEIEILLDGNSVKSLSVSSDNENNIDKIYILDWVIKDFPSNSSFYGYPGIINFDKIDSWEAHPQLL